MAKKFVRGITDIKTINNQDLDTNNVNDLLSDGKHNYIHRKKSDGTEEYHNLTNNIKTIQSDDTDLLTVTNYNNTTNTATIRPKHDSQKEQVLESTDNTIVITHGENGTDETTSVDVNPAKVLEHANLLTGEGLIRVTENNKSTIHIEYRYMTGYDLNNQRNGLVRSDSFLHAPHDNTMFFVSAFTHNQDTFQKAVNIISQNNIKTYYRTRLNGVWGEWREEVTDKTVIDNLLGQKQNTLSSNTSIGLDGTGLMQLYSYEMSYMVTSSVKEGSLNTYAKTVKKNTLTAEPKLEYHFTAELNEGKTSITVPLNNNDTTYFTYILIKYGQASGSTQTAMINGLVFSLSGSNLTISRDSSTYSQVVSFSDIIDPQ